MATIQQALDRGLQFQQVGDLARAEAAYRQILAAHPQCGPAWHYLGAVFFQRQDLPQAIEYMQRSVECEPAVSSFFSNLGLAFYQARRMDEAAAALRRALELEPNDADAWMKLGNVQNAQRDAAGAEVSYRKALALDPRRADVLNNLGAMLTTQGAPEEAVSVLQASLALAPGYPGAHFNLGSALQRLERYGEAEACYRRAIELQPADPEFLLGLAMLLLEQDRLQESHLLCVQAAQLAPDLTAARRCLARTLSRLHYYAAAVVEMQEVLRREPDDASAHSDLCALLMPLGRLEESVAHGRRAIELSPDWAPAHDNLGAAIYRQGKLGEALACFDRAIQFDPEYGMAHFHRAMVWLLQGDFAAGWREYEWRWSHPMAKGHRFEKPRWQGEPLAGKTIVLQAEQGFGDTLHFVRYAPRLKESGARVWLRCPPALKDFLATCPGFDGIVAEGEPLPPYDYYCPLLSMLGVLGVTPDAPATESPYLFASPELTSRWQPELERLPGLRVGIAWQGDPKHGWDLFRSIPLETFAPLAKVPGVRLVSLQRGPGEEQLSTASFPIHVFNPPLDDQLASFCDTAAVLRAIDLLICVDTAVAHLAGGLSVPVWLLLNTSPDWRWGLAGETTPWYPTMRLWRQQRLGDWGPVFEQIAAELRRLAADKEA